MTSLHLIHFMQNGIKYEVLAQMNGQKSTDILKIGQVLNLIQVYDEQIELVDESDEPLSLLDYVIYLENGSEVVGTTDEMGLTDMVNTNISIGIIGIEFLNLTEGEN